MSATMTQPECSNLVKSKAIHHKMTRTPFLRPLVPPLLFPKRSSAQSRRLSCWPTTNARHGRSVIEFESERAQTPFFKNKNPPDVNVVSSNSSLVKEEENIAKI